MPTTTSTPVGLAQRVARPTPRRTARASAAKLYDVPVSNNGARVRIALYAKGLVPDRVEIVSPSELGGIKSEEYMALQPKGQMPLLVTESGLPIWESEVILGYVLDKYDGEGPSFTLDTAEERALSTLSTKVFDTFIQPVQGCMYRKSPSAEQRAAELKVIDENLHILESLCSADGPYFVGGRPCKTDMSLFPSFVFFEFMLETQFGWPDAFYDKPKLRAWYEYLKAGEGSDFAGVTARVYGEIFDALKAWEEGGRWEVQGIKEHLEVDLKWVYP